MYCVNPILIHNNIHNIHNINNLRTTTIRSLSPQTYLISSVLLETGSTLCLKNTIVNPKWFIPAYTGYGISFYIFPKCLTHYSLSTAYTLWCGFGIIFTLLFDRIVYREIIGSKKWFGSLIIILGIYLSH
jgi:small multidrug resistance pump